ncbi:uncharacterized protein LOC116433426 [Nomia melanderi]|uniref:uncharacterized protein LOC116433426 n=1 Tax=Nomia melanderi TaxID=2448451 RepID=UPI0013042AB3|nr:uncharacterized protein LOC116433426 [Nomia melanderi]
MRSRVNLVAFLLTLCCVARLLETSKTASRQQAQRGDPGKDVLRDHAAVAKKLLKGAQSKPAATSAVSLLVHDKTRTANALTKNRDLPLSKDILDEGRRRKKRKMDRTMLALLMAYKMKFVALVPTLVGGLVLLKATALLAGFFFALFAAVLGLKVR